MLYETEHIKTEIRKKIYETNELCSLNEEYEAPAYSRGYDFGRVMAFRDMLMFIEKLEDDELDKEYEEYIKHDQTELENMFKEHMKHEEHINMTDTDFFD